MINVVKHCPNRCEHHCWAEDNKVYLVNEEDGWSLQEFKNRKEIMVLINDLQAAADKAFGKT